jgi:hydroxymethylpyrimidine/phosphomethylpyrimidine kinase
VLLTGTHEGTEKVINSLYGRHEKIESQLWQRLPYSYHGSGCTLTSAIAALMAQGFSVPQAVTIAQEYAWNTLMNGFQSGMGQHHPDRFYWVENWAEKWLHGSAGNASNQGSDKSANHFSKHPLEKRNGN